MKRYIYIIIGIVAAAILIILVLLFIKSRSAAPTITTGTTGTLPATGTQTTPTTQATGTGTGSTPGNGSTSGSGTNNSSSTSGVQAGVQSFGVISNDPVADYYIDPQNNVIAIQPSGAIIKISNGQSTGINSSTISDIISANFSYDGKKILVNFGDPSNPQSSVFDVATNAWTPLPQGLQSPQWSPSSYQVAFLSTPSTGELALSTLDATSAATIKRGVGTLLTLKASDLSLQWPLKNIFILSDKPTINNAGSIWQFNSQTGSLTSLAYEVAGAEGVWNKSTSTSYGLLFLPRTSATPLQLSTIPSGNSLQTLTFSTLPSKCLFNTEQTTATSTAALGKSTSTVVITKKVPYVALYCAIPRSGSAYSSASLPDDYNTMALFTSDDIAKVNTVTGEMRTLWNDGGQNIDATDMKYFNSALFFLNRYDQKLYGLTFVPQQ